MEQAREKYEVRERHACRLLGQWRRTQRYEGMRRADKDVLTAAIIALASEYGRRGYRRITALLQEASWQVGRDRVQRIWRREGLRVPQNKGCRDCCCPSRAGEKGHTIIVVRKAYAIR